MWGSQRVGKGARLQSGIPKRRVQVGRQPANGLLLHGVVMATYVTDDDNHPQAEDSFGVPTAVYCDVIAYGSLPGQRWQTLAKVLVSQNRGGLRRGDIWKPRATSVNILGELNEDTGSNIGYFDGDHVLIGFLNNNLDQPIILRGLPHPSRDTGNQDLISGKRMKLKLADGDPEFCKHHGVHWGVTDAGDFLVDSTFGNDGSISGDGKEPAAATDGSAGNQVYKVPKDSEYAVVFYDMTDPENPTEIDRMVISNDGSDSSLQLGDGAVAVAIADHLETLYGNLKSTFDAHTHPSGTGPTGITATALSAWDSGINSNKMTIPDN